MNNDNYIILYPYDLLSSNYELILFNFDIEFLDCKKKLHQYGIYFFICYIDHILIIYVYKCTIYFSFKWFLQWLRFWNNRRLELAGSSWSLQVNHWKLNGLLGACIGACKAFLVDNEKDWWVKEAFCTFVCIFFI